MIISQRITIDLNDVPEFYVKQVIEVCNNFIHNANDEFGSLAVMTITPLPIEEQEADNG